MKKVFAVDCNRGRIVFNPDGLKAVLKKREKKQEVKVYGNIFTKPSMRKYR